MLGDLVFVATSRSADAKAGEACAVVESVKAASDVYAPVDGEVVAFNESLGSEPQQLNVRLRGVDLQDQASSASAPMVAPIPGLRDANVHAVSCQVTAARRTDPSV